MKYMLTALLALTLCIPAFSKEQKTDFQTGKIVQVEKLPGGAKPVPAPPGYSSPDPSDAQEGASTSGYDVSIQVGDTIYTCRLKSYDPNGTEFAVGSDVEARASKRILYLKHSSGDVEEARIISKKKADTQAQAQ